jgi:hypothetical protein
MANKTKNGYRCGYCNKLFADPIECDNHKETHQLIYVALSKQDLNRLVQFIYTQEQGLLTETLVENLKKYLKGSFEYVEKKV